VIRDHHLTERLELGIAGLLHRDRAELDLGHTSNGGF
jgi:hypothetical protein